MAYRQFNKSGFRTKSKYGNKTRHYNGRTYDSIREATHAEELDWRKKAGEIKEIIPQFKIDIRVNGIHICNYFIDFKCIMSDDSVQFHEVKGMVLPVWELKWKLCQALKDEIEIGAEWFVIK